jgi:hypothetical protein
MSLAGAGEDALAWVLAFNEECDFFQAQIEVLRLIAFFWHFLCANVGFIYS